MEKYRLLGQAEHAYYNTGEFKTINSTGIFHSQIALISIYKTTNKQTDKQTTILFSEMFTFPDQKIEVPLKYTKKCSWCCISKIIFTQIHLL
jgi:hypothetical protein